MLVDAFKNSIFPYIVQLGVIMFVYSICSCGYSLFRQHNFQQFIDKLKASLLAYIIIRGAFTIVEFVDNIVENINLWGG